MTTTIIPDWMLLKVSRLALINNDDIELRHGSFKEILKNVPRNYIIEMLSELELQSVIMLKADLTLYPSLTYLVPPGFIQELMSTIIGNTLSPLYRAAIVITETDAAAIHPDFPDIEGFTRLKWEALASILKEATK